MELRRSLRLASKSSGKRTAYSSDRLGSLPDELLIYAILSLLDTKQVVQMSILSRRWRDIWKSLPSINIFWNAKSKEEEFIRFVNNVSTLRLSDNDNDIHKFCLQFPKDATHHYSSLVCSLADTVVQKNLQECHLESAVIYSSLLHKLVNKVKTLKLLSVTIYTQRKGYLCDFQRNSHLHLTCSTLESLTLSKCFYLYKTIYIYAPRLKHLVIQNDAHQLCETTIYAPNLTQFHLKGYITRGCIMEDVSSLVDAHIDTRGFVMEDEMRTRSLIYLLKGVVNVKSLTLSADACQIPEGFPSLWKEMPIFYPNLKYLKVTDLCDKMNMNALAKLIGRFCSVETLVLERNQEPFDGLFVELTEQLMFECMLNKLKSVVIQGVKGYKYELSFLSLLIKNAIALEKITISAFGPISRTAVKRWEIFNEELRALVGASSNAAISSSIVVLNKGTQPVRLKPCKYKPERGQATAVYQLGMVEKRDLPFL